MTRGGWPGRRPEDEVNSGETLGGAGGGVGGAIGVGAGAAACGGIGGGVAPSTGTFCDGGFCGKRGVVFAVGGAPVTGGARGRGGVWPSGAVFAMVGIGLVTAVDQAGGTLLTGVGSRLPGAFIGSVLAPETVGRGGLILADAGLSGRGGRLIRSVSRLGAFGSEPSLFAESAIIFPFYSYFEKMFNREICNYNGFIQLTVARVLSNPSELTHFP